MRVCLCVCVLTRKEISVTQCTAKVGVGVGVRIWGEKKRKQDNFMQKMMPKFFFKERSLPGKEQGKECFRKSKPHPQNHGHSWNFQ